VEPMINLFENRLHFFQYICSLKIRKIIVSKFSYLHVDPKVVHVYRYFAAVLELFEHV